MSNTTILLVEDDEDIVKINSIYLKQQGYKIIEAGTAKQANREVLAHRPNLIILDINLPDASGITFCQQIRNVTTAPIVFLTCFDEEADKIEGLMAGGDDYMTKPYSLSELAARIHALLRRVNINDEKIYRFPPVTIDAAAQRVYLNGKDVALTLKEYQLLLLLAKHRGYPINTADLYKKLWGQTPEEGIKTVHVHIASIRRKLKLGCHMPVQIKTIRNAGYCFDYMDATDASDNGKVML